MEIRDSSLSLVFSYFIDSQNEEDYERKESSVSILFSALTHIIHNPTFAP